MKVFVYKNLHRGLYSVKALEGPYKGRVIGYFKELTLINCEFRVSQKGKQRVLDEGRKNVHAGVIGNLLTEYRPLMQYSAYYNPYNVNQFVDKDSGVEVLQASLVTLDAKGVYYNP